MLDVLSNDHICTNMWIWCLWHRKHRFVLHHYLRFCRMSVEKLNISKNPKMILWFWEQNSINCPSAKSIIGGLPRKKRETDFLLRKETNTYQRWEVKRAWLEIEVTNFAAFVFDLISVGHTPKHDKFLEGFLRSPCKMHFLDTAWWQKNESPLSFCHAAQQRNLKMIQRPLLILASQA